MILVHHHFFDENSIFFLQKGPVAESVFSKHLVSESVKYIEIVTHYQSYYKDVLQQNFEGDVLGYVTPVSL